MNLSRKAFLRRGMVSLGETLLNPGRLLGETGEAGPGVAVVRDDRCLARRGGCFSCLDSCPEEAITLEPGGGIRIDRERCTGCGDCVAICPVTPKALAITRPAPEGVTRTGRSTAGTERLP